MTISRAPPVAGRGHRALLQERPRERRDDQRDRRRAQQQQQPVADAPPPHRLVRNPPHEHQRRELDDALPLALNQVDQHRNGDGAEAEQEEGGQERHACRSELNWS